MGSADKDLRRHSTKPQGLLLLPATCVDYLVHAYRICGLDLAKSALHDFRSAVNRAYHLQLGVMIHRYAIVFRQRDSTGKDNEKDAKSSCTAIRGENRKREHFAGFLDNCEHSSSIRLDIMQ